MSFKDREFRDRLERTLGRIRALPRGSDPVPLEQALPGDVLETEFGSCYCVETAYPVDHRHGCHSFRSVLEVDRGGVCVAGKDRGLVSYEPCRCVFLDTETTGLAGGSGTYAFLVGLGYYENDEFVVRQIFMRDYDEEGALLSVLARAIEGRDFVVTYNGKTFDVPLIEGRLVMCRMSSLFRDMGHLDLLHAARRIWGRRLSDCRLTTVEGSVLGLRRADDIPSEEIPERYFEFLRTGDASGLAIVFEHNRYDVMLLPILLAEICGAVGDVDHRGLEPIDLLSIGRVYDSLKMRNETVPFYARAVRGLTGDDRTAAAWRLGLVYKRLERWDEAVSTWKGLLRRGAYGPYEELAKYYEHVSRELDKAAKTVVDALSVFSGTAHEAGLLHRLKRIEEKLSRGAGLDHK